MKYTLPLLLLIICGLAACAGQTSNTKLSDTSLTKNEHAQADTVFINGKIYTVDESQAWVEALAIKGERLVGVGNNNDIKKWIGADTNVIDLNGKMAMPGINDAHTHLYGGLKTLYYCNFPSSSGLPEIKTRLQECINDKPEQSFIMGGYWASDFFDKHKIESPKAWLDSVTGDVAVILSDDSGHNGWVNSAALKTLGYTAQTKDPEGGRILRLADGEPNGILYEVAAENAEAFFESQWPSQARQTSLRYTVKEINGYGITGIKDASTRHDDLRALHAIDQAEGLTAHITTSIFTPYGPRKEALDYDFYSELAEQNKSTNIRTNSIKFFLDGVPTSSRSAAMLSPYLPDHKHSAHGGENKGSLHIQGELLNNDLIEFDKRGFTIKLHAAGDRSVRVALDAIEHVRAVNGNKDQMHEVAHAGFISDQDISRFKELNVAPDISPYLWFPSPIVDNIVSVLAERGERYFPNKMLTDAGATIIAGSDWPSVSLTPNPWPGIEATITRKNPFKSEEKQMWPEQALSVEQTLKIFTVNGAKALGLLDQTGSVTVGKYADLIVLKDNIFEIPQEAIGETTVLQTWFKGQKVQETPEQ